MCTSGSIGSSQEKESTQAVSISATNDPANGASSSSSMATSMSKLKERGNCLLNEGKPKAAVKAYTDALQNAALDQLDDQQKAVLLSNRSAAYVKAHLNAKVYANCCVIVFQHSCIPRCKDLKWYHNKLIERLHIGLLNSVGNMQAEADARQAIKLAPTWPKPLHRLAQALQVTVFPRPTNIMHPFI